MKVLEKEDDRWHKEEWLTRDTCGFMVGSTKVSTHLYNSAERCLYIKGKVGTQCAAEAKKSIKIPGRFCRERISKRLF